MTINNQNTTGKINKISQKNTVKGALISGVFVMCVYYFLASSYPMEQRLKSSIGHALFCTCMTFVTVNLMQYFFGFFNNVKAKYLSAIVFTSMIGITLMTIVHTLLGTPNILHTIFLSCLSGLPFFILFPLKLVADYKKVNPKDF